MNDAVGGRVGTVIKGKWHVDARIGSGGMATVYAATHRNGHRAALKMLHAQLSRDAAVRARFLREAYVANTVSHPAVVRVDDDDVTEDGCVFLVMELLEGETLEARRLRNENGALPIGEVMEIGEQALDALAAAHEKGIIHRDVKPENVFVTKAGRVKLLDFGLARMKDLQGGESTKTGVTIGTPEFMPPEQAMAKRGNVDARSDVWGMGATLFTALSGKYVHDAPNLHQQLMAAATQRARSVRSVATHVPLAVGQVIDRALELDMNDRWSSAREMQRALRAARGAPADVSLESLTVPAALPDAPLPSEDVPFPISSDKTVAVSDVVSSDKPTLQRPVTVQDKTIALTGPASSSPSTERITRGEKPTARLETTAKLAPTTPRMSGQSGENPALGKSGQTQALGFSASGENPALRQSPRMFAASGANPALGASGMNPALGASGANPALGASGANPALGASGMNPVLDQSGSDPRIKTDSVMRGGSGSVAPPSPSRARGALVAIILVLLGLAALTLALLARTGHLPR